MSSETSEKMKSSTISLPSFVALALLSISVYHLAPDAIKWSKEALTIAVCRLSPPKGHLKPLGQQAPPLEPIQEITEWPTPEIFFREYVEAQKPVLFKGLAKTIPAYHKWTDDYLREKFGHEEVAVEIGLKQVNYGENLYLNIMSEFLNSYKHKGIYLVDTISPARFADVVLPRPLRCGNFQRALSDVIMWLSNGNTKSIVHTDYVDNINCVLDGKKKVHLFRKDYTDKHMKDFIKTVELDVDSVDLCEFPAYANLPRYEIDVQAGDCFYLPFQWYHQVQASSERNLGLNFWFQHLIWFNTSDCSTKDINTDFHFGAHDMPTGAQLKQLELLTYAKKKPMDKSTFFKAYLHESITDKDSITTMFNDADVDQDGMVSVEELHNMEPNHFMSFFKEVGGLRFLNYTRDRGNLDAEVPNMTKPVKL